MLSMKIDLCTGCRRCEVACAMAHFDLVDSGRARIRVAKLEESGVDAPVFCVSCAEHFCVDGCPRDALSVTARGTIAVDPSLCDGCEVCAICCPIGAIEMVDGLPISCDLCEGRGEQSCVRACPTAVLAADAPPETVSLKPFAKNRRGRNDDVKRLRYVEFLGRPLRDEWSRRCSVTREKS